jgi:Transmembrane family 220, helix
MRFLDYVFAVMFLAMAGLQFNDPDPIYWVAVYGGAALVALSRALGRYSEFWAAITIGAAVAGLLMAIPGVLNFIDFGSFSELFGDMHASKPYIESTREFGGLMLVLIVLASYVKR